MVAVADPDEWDDEKIDKKIQMMWLSSIQYSALLQFDFSFRMGKNQDFEIHLPFNGKAPISTDECEL